MCAFTVNHIYEVSTCFVCSFVFCSVVASHLINEKWLKVERRQLFWLFSRRLWVAAVVWPVFWSCRFCCGWCCKQMFTHFVAQFPQLFFKMLVIHIIFSLTLYAFFLNILACINNMYYKFVCACNLVIRRWFIVRFNACAHALIFLSDSHTYIYYIHTYMCLLMCHKHSLHCTLNCIRRFVHIYNYIPIAVAVDILSHLRNAL